MKHLLPLITGIVFAFVWIACGGPGASKLSFSALRSAVAQSGGTNFVSKTTSNCSPGGVESIDCTTKSPCPEGSTAASVGCDCVSTDGSQTPALHAQYVDQMGNQGICACYPKGPNPVSLTTTTLCL